jgi:O-antigen ligase
MFKLAFFLIWTTFYISRIPFLSRNTRPSILLVSYFLTVIPLQINIPIGNAKFNILSGTLGSQMYIFMALILFCCFLPLFQFKLTPRGINKKTLWIWVFMGLILISLINPHNENVSGTLIVLSLFVSHILFFNLLHSNISPQNILKGIYDGFFILGLANFILAICFPLLNLKLATTLFHLTGDIAATRMGSVSRSGAIGFFPHPGPLALYSTISSVFFLHYIIQKRRLTQSKIIFILNLLTIILAFSRTTYLVYILVMITSYYILKYPHKSIFSAKNMTRVFLPLVLMFVWLIVFSPFNKIFIESDINAQLDNRSLHWVMAFQAFKVSPFVGVGLNTHLVFLASHPSLLKSLDIGNFFLENPIHNIHLIILVELGIVGLIGWIYFLVKRINESKRQISDGTNVLFSITQIAAILAFILYGMTGWAPFSLNIIPFFLFIIYFANKYQRVPQQPEHQ